MVARSLSYPSSAEGNVEATTQILIVDDDAASLALHRDVLQCAGFQVETAPDGVAALWICRTRKPQLVLLDLLMPGIDGGEVLQRLRNDERTKTIPVIALTGVPEWLQSHRTSVAEFDDILLKPVPEALLIERVCRKIAAPPCKALAA
jgi:two-component system, cell cycle response regulator